jgi:hypothetical protein
MIYTRISPALSSCQGNAVGKLPVEHPCSAHLLLNETLRGTFDVLIAAGAAALEFRISAAAGQSRQGGEQTPCR